MTNWTTEALARHRARMGWPPLGMDESDQVVAILNDALGKFDGVGPLPGVEPAMVFVASHRSAAKQEAGS